jgi:D-alanine-D-alanine ligase
MKHNLKGQVKQLGRVGLLFGGTSNERSVSLKSGVAVYKALARSGVDVIKIDTANGFQKKIKHNKVDIAFLALHGKGGEDGTIQSFLNSRQIPFVGADAKASRLSFNKYQSKRVFVRCNIPTPRFKLVCPRNWKEIIHQWKVPYVLKPVREGSSIGVYFIQNKDEGRRFAKLLIDTYGEFLIEEKIEGREFSVSLLDGKPLPLIEICTKRRFYDYRAKYTKGLTRYVVPARVSPGVLKRIRQHAVHAYRALGLRDMARADFLLNRSGKAYLLEMNSIPGFTETSLLPKAARKAGLEFSELCVRLLQMAYRRARK